MAPVPGFCGALPKLRLTGRPSSAGSDLGTVMRVFLRPHRQPKYWGQPLWRESSPEAAGALCGRRQPQQQVTTHAPTKPPCRRPERPQCPRRLSGRPRHLHARGSPAGQKRNFLGPSGRVGKRSADGHEAPSTPRACTDYDSRYAPQVAYNSHRVQLASGQ